MAEAHYYSEDYNLEWAAKAYVDALSEPERKLFDAVMVDRLTGRPGLDDLSVCARLDRPLLLPWLKALLDCEPRTSAASRALLTALTNLADGDSYTSVERFMDSDQEGEALQCLARIDFPRSLTHLRRAVCRDHLHNFCLHAMHDYMRSAGIQALTRELRRLINPDPGRLAPHVRKILYSKQGSYNPFSEDELKTLTTALI